MPRLRICAEIQGLCEDENGNSHPGGFELSFEGFPEEGFEEKYKKLVASITPEMVLKAACLDDIYQPENCRIITPEEFDRKYGGESCEKNNCF